MVAQKRTEHGKDSAIVNRCNHKFGFHNRGVQWDTPMSRWAGEGKDWIQLVAQGPPRKEDVMISLLKMMRQPTEKKPQKGGGVPKKKPKDLGPLVLELPSEDKKLMLGQWPCQAEDVGKYCCDCPESLLRMVGPWSWLEATRG